MQQMFPQLEPPSKSNTMKEVGWPIILVIATLVGTILGAIIQGTTHIIGFNWLMIIWGCVMFTLTVFFAWYSIRTRQRLQEQYNKDRASSQAEYQKFKQRWESYFENERHRWDEWAVNFTKQSDQEHREHTKKLKQQCMEAISDAELRLDVSIKNAQSIFAGAVESNGIIVDQYRSQLIHAMRRMDALEKRLEEMVTPDKENNSATHEIN